METRKSMERPRSFTRKRPSWGTRFSAMSSSAMTLMRLMIVEWCSLAIGFMAGWSTPSMRYLITTSLSRVSMWMSEARRFRASKIVESTRRMIGDWSAWILSMERTSSPFSSSRRIWILKDSEACSSTRCVPWPRLSASWMAEGVPTAGWIGRLQQQAQLVHHRDVGGVGHHQHQAARLAPVGQEVVAEHQLHGHRLQDLGVGGEAGHVHVLEAVAGGQARARRLLLGGAAPRAATSGVRSSDTVTLLAWMAEMASNMGR